MALFETARADVKVVHKEHDRQRLCAINNINNQAATKRLKTLGTVTIQASSLLAKRQASAGVMREVSCKQRRRLRLRPPK